LGRKRRKEEGGGFRGWLKEGGIGWE